MCMDEFAFQMYVWSEVSAAILRNICSERVLLQCSINRSRVRFCRAPAHKMFKRRWWFLCRMYRTPSSWCVVLTLRFCCLGSVSLAWSFYVEECCLYPQDVNVNVTCKTPLMPFCCVDVAHMSCHGMIVCSDVCCLGLIISPVTSSTPRVASFWAFNVKANTLFVCQWYMHISFQTGRVKVWV